MACAILSGCGSASSTRGAEPPLSPEALARLDLVADFDGSLDVIRVPAFDAARYEGVMLVTAPLETQDLYLGSAVVDVDFVTGGIDGSVTEFLSARYSDDTFEAVTDVEAVDGAMALTGDYSLAFPSVTATGTIDGLDADADLTARVVDDGDAFLATGPGTIGERDFDVGILGIRVPPAP